FPFVEDLLKKYGEFYPVGCAVTIKDSIAQIGEYNGDEHPLSNTVIADLKAAFRGRKDDYKSIAIFYDVRVVNPKTNIKTDAIAVFAESKNEATAYIFYYPYVLTTDKQLTYADS